MVDGKRACLQTSEGELQGGLYLDPTSKPKTYDFVMSGRTIEGIYSLDGDTLRLCYNPATDAKRPLSFATERESSQFLFVLKRTYGPDVWPFRLADGTRAFPTLVERKGTTPPPPPKVAPQPDPKIGDIIIVGNTKTKDAAILKKIPLRPGDALDYEALRTAGKNLAALNATIAVIVSSDGADYWDIQVTVVER
jgi:hypothetical protein